MFTDSNKYGKRKNYSISLCLLSCIGLQSSCDSGFVPSDGTLEISPNSHTIQTASLSDDAGQCLYFSENYIDIPLVFQLSTSNGSPIGDAWIEVYADFSAGTYSGEPVLALYDDFNGNGVVDSETELISGIENDIPRIKTGQYTGSKNALLRVNLSCPYRAEIRGIAGGIYGSAVIQVTGSLNTSSTLSSLEEL